MIVHMVPEHEKAGKIVRDPIVFPWVLDVAVETWRKQKQEQIDGHANHQEGIRATSRWSPGKAARL